MKNKIILVLTTVIVSTLFIVGCESADGKDSIDNSIPVKVEKVKEVEYSAPVHTSGMISAAKEIKLSFKTGGLVESVLVREGESVRKGEVLAKLKMEEINAQVTQAENGYEKAKRDYERVKNLYADSVVTLENLQDAETGAEVAKAQLEIAKFNQKHSTITAPSDGSIQKQLVEPNEMVSPGMPVFFFGSNSGNEWKLKVGTADRDVIRLSIGDSAHVTLDVYPGTIIKAYVTEIGEMANPYNGTFEVELQLESMGIKISSGFVAKADIYPSESDEYTSLPVESLIDANELSGYAYIVDNINSPSPSFEKIEVKIKHILNDKVLAKKIAGIDYVITEGSAYLTADSQIKVINQ